MEESILSRTLAHLLRPKLLVLVILVAGLTSVAVALSRLARGLELSLLFLVIFLALPAGWTLARSRLTFLIAAPIALLSGALFLIVRLGGLFGRISLVYRAFWDWMVVDPSLFVPPARDPVSISSAWLFFWEGFSITTARTAGWIANLMRGQGSYDLVGSAFLWSLALWLVSVWAGWSARRGHTALLIFLPALALLGGTLAYSSDKVGPLGFLLGLVLFSTFALAHFRRESRWQADGLDFSPELRLDVILSAVPVAGGLLAFALLSPTISFDRISDWLNDWSRSRGVEAEQAGQPLGLQPRPGPTLPLQDYRAPGLPRSHLIGSGPELSQEIALTIRTFEIAPGPPQYVTENPPRYYWRGLTYDRYTGRGWATGPTREQSYAPGEILTEQDPNRFRILRQVVTRLRNPGDIVHVSGIPRRSAQSMDATWRAPDDLFAIRSSGEQFDIESWVPAYDRDELRSISTQPPAEIRDRYLALPSDIPDRVLGLARDLTASAPTAYEQALAIQAYLRTYPYTLDLPAPPANRDVVDYFLFDLRQGYCDYYATSMVVLARAAGLPARLAIGYATGSYDTFSASYVVSEAQAHSWPEIYFAGYGWVQFEPTAAQPEIGDDRTSPRLPALSSSPAPLPTPAPVAGLTVPLAWAVAIFAGAFLIGLAFQPWRLFFPSPASNSVRRAIKMEKSLRQVAGWLEIPHWPGDTVGELCDRLAGWLEQHNRTAAARSVQAASAYIQAAYYSRRQPSLAAGSSVEAGLARLPLQALVLRMIRRVSRLRKP